MNPRATWAAVFIVLACSRVANPPPPAGDRHATLPEAAPPLAREPASASAAPLAKATPAEFSLVKELDCLEPHLYPFSGKTFLSCQQELLVVEGNEVRSDPAVQRGIELEQPSFLWNIGGMAGDWPGAVWLGTNRTTESAARGRIHHWTGKRWVKVEDARWWEALYDLVPWTEHRVLALVQPPDTFGARFVPLGKKPFTAPTFTRPHIPFEQCFTRIRAEAVAVLRPGELMVAGGQVCEVVTTRSHKEGIHSGIGVERFRADRPSGELMLLSGFPPEVPPDAAWEVTALVARTPGEVLLAAQSAIGRGRMVGYWARWNGTNFVSEPPPIGGGVHRLWVETPEVLWATDLEERLWRARGGEWRPVPWSPPDAADTEISQVWARGPGDVWIITFHRLKNRSGLYHGHWEPERSG